MKNFIKKYKELFIVILTILISKKGFAMTANPFLFIHFTFSSINWIIWLAFFSISSYYLSFLIFYNLLFLSILYILHYIENNVLVQQQVLLHYILISELKFYFSCTCFCNDDFWFFNSIISIPACFWSSRKRCNCNYTILQ